MNIYPRDTITIKLTLPDKSLSPNARVHWAKKAKATTMARMEAKLMTMKAMYPHDGPKWSLASIQCTFTFPDKRRRDRDNADASCKAYRDGIADAGVVLNDYDFSPLPPIVTEPDKSAVGVVVTITRIE